MSMNRAVLVAVVSFTLGVLVMDVAAHFRERNHYGSQLEKNTTDIERHRLQIDDLQKFTTKTNTLVHELADKSK